MMQEVAVDTVDSHGPILPFEARPDIQISIIEAFPGTMQLPTSVCLLPKFGTVVKPYTFKLCYPLHLADHLGSMSAAHVDDSNKMHNISADPTDIPPARFCSAPLIKFPTGRQSGHPDEGYEDYQGWRSVHSDPRFLSYLLPISPICNVTGWEDSHELMEVYDQADEEVQAIDGETYADRQVRILQHIISNAHPLSDLRMGKKIQPKQIAISRGRSMMFLSSFIHAGSALDDRDDCINVRMHIYGTRPGKKLQQGGSGVPPLIVQHMCEGWQGTEQKLLRVGCAEFHARSEARVASEGLSHSSSSTSKTPKGRSNKQQTGQK
jgi:hypothetical protein